MPTSEPRCDLRYGARSRRQALRVAGRGAAALAGAALMACVAPKRAAGPLAGTSATAPGQRADERAVKRGGGFRTGLTGVFAGVDPHTSVSGGSGVVALVNAYLFRKEVLRPDLGLKWDLCVSRELAPDQITWILKLRGDAKISPNAQGIPERALDSSDVIASFRRMADRASGANAYPFFSTWVDHFDAPDPGTVRLVTKRPYAWTEEALGDALRGAIAPREWLARGKDLLLTDAVGAGPFMLKSLTEGRDAVLVANPNFYGSPLPNLGTYQIVAYRDQTTYRTAFAAGQLDAYFAQGRDEALELERTVRGVRRLEVQTTGFNSFWMRTDSAPWRDERARRAMNRAMDRAEYIALIGKHQGLPAGPIPPVFGEYALPQDELARLQPFDPTEARQLFEAAGVNEVTFAHPTSSSMPDYVTVMVEQLRRIGIAAKPSPMEAGTWLSNYYSGRLTASFSLNQSYKTPDAALLWYRTGGVTGTGAYDTKWSRPEIDDAIDRAAGMLDPKQRVAMYQEAQRLILRSDPPFINVFQIGGNPLVYDRVQAYDVGPGAMSYYMARFFWIDS